MSVLKKLATSVALAGAMFGTPGFAQDDVRIALVVKALGIGFFEAANEGAQEAAEELGNVEIIYTGPTDTTAEGQIEVINALIAQQVDAIAISSNDTDALVPVLQRAMQRGITVISWDSGVAPEGRQLHLNPSSNPLIGNMIIKLAADHLPKGGEVALLSATTTSTVCSIPSWRTITRAVFTSTSCHATPWPGSSAAGVQNTASATYRPNAERV